MTHPTPITAEEVARCVPEDHRVVQDADGIRVYKPIPAPWWYFRNRAPSWRLVYHFTSASNMAGRPITAEEVEKVRKLEAELVKRRLALVYGPVPANVRVTDPA